MDVSVIIVNFKSLEKTKRCVKAVENSDWEALSHETIVVDNASGDNIDGLKKDFSGILVINNPENSGMGEGNNLGIKNSTGEYILILNPDTYVEKGAIKAMCSYMRANPKAGIIGPKLYYPDGRLQQTCLRFPSVYTPILRRTFLGRFFNRHINNFVMADFDHASVKEVDWMMGSCLLVRREMLNKIGPAFDKKFFMFFEDTDLCRRAKACGYASVYLPEAQGVHDHGRGSAVGRWYIAPFTNKLARAHIASWFKYFWKWK